MSFIVVSITLVSDVEVDRGIVWPRTNLKFRRLNILSGKTEEQEEENDPDENFHIEAMHLGIFITNRPQPAIYKFLRGKINEFEDKIGKFEYFPNVDFAELLGSDQFQIESARKLVIEVIWFPSFDEF